MSGVRLIHLIRHGRSDFDSNEFLETPRGKQWDPPLAEEGREQALLLTRRLAAMDRPAAILCSPFRRTRETIAPYVELTGIQPGYVDDLGEAYIGDWEGLSFEEILETDEDLLHRFRDQDPIWRHAPGAEDVADLRVRVRRAIDRALETIPGGDLLVVAHGGVINAYVGPLLGLDLPMFFLPDNTSLNTVMIDHDGPSVRFLNDVRHLTDPEVFGS